MTESEAQIARPFAETLAEHQIHVTVEEAHEIACSRERWQDCMRWLKALDVWLFLQEQFPTPPACLRKHLTKDQQAGLAAAFRPPKPKPKTPSPSQQILFP